MENAHYGWQRFTGRAPEFNPPCYPFKSRHGFERRHTGFPRHPDWFPQGPYRGYRATYMNTGHPYWNQTPGIHHLDTGIISHSVYENLQGTGYHPADRSRNRQYFFLDPQYQRRPDTYSNRSGCHPQSTPWWSAAFQAPRDGVWEGDSNWKDVHTAENPPQPPQAVPNSAPNPPIDVPMNSHNPQEDDNSSIIDSSCHSDCDPKAHDFDDIGGLRGPITEPAMSSGARNPEGVGTSSGSSQSTHATYMPEPSFPTAPGGGHDGFEPPRSGSRQSVHDFFGDHPPPEECAGSRGPQPFRGSGFRGEFPPDYTSPPRLPRVAHTRDSENRRADIPQQPPPCHCSRHDSGMDFSFQEEMLAARLADLEAREAHAQEVEAALHVAEAELQQEQERLMHASAILREERAEFEDHRNQFWREWRRQQRHYERQHSYQFADSDFDMLSSDDEEPAFPRGSPPFFEWNGFSVSPAPGSPPETVDEDMRQAFEEYNKHWDGLSSDDAAIRYPTPSGNGGDLLDVGSRFMRQITASTPYNWAPKLPNSNLRIHPHQVVRYNVFGFFISAFEIRLRLVVDEACENGSSPQWRPDFRGADQEALKRLRDHLRRNEQKRWHPDQMNRRRNGGVGDEEVFLKEEISMSGREVREAVQLGITDLRQAYLEKTLRGDL